MDHENPENCELNISSPNYKLIEHGNRPSYYVERMFFYPKERVIFTRVCDDNGIICESTEPVTYANLYKRYGEQYLLRVNVRKGESRFFVKMDGKWEEISFDEFGDYETYMYRLGGADKYCMIDISKPEDTKYWRINKTEHNGNDRVHFYPKLGYYARAVVDGQQVIWMPGNDAQVCEDVITTYKKNQKKLAKVWVGDLRGTTLRYYRCVNGQWHETDEENFIESLYSCDSQGISYEPNCSRVEGVNAPSIACVTCQ